MVEQGHDPRAQSINVNLPRRGSSLGVASLVLGVVAFTICWIPFLGILGVPLSGLGLLLGAFGVLVALARRGAGIGFPIAGTLVCGVALTVAIMFTSAAATVISAVADAVEAGATADDAVTVANSDDEGEPAQDPTEAESKPAEPASPSKPRRRAAERKPKAPEKPVVEWMPADQPLMIGDTKVEVSSVRLGKVPVIQQFTKEASSSENTYLQIGLKITNLSQTKKLEYRTWAGEEISILRDSAAIRDNFENDYRRIRFQFGVLIKGRTDQASVYPNKSIDDILVFEPPIDGVEHLELELPGRNIGQEEDLRFRIPAKLIQRENAEEVKDKP